MPSQIKRYACKTCKLTHNTISNKKLRLPQFQRSNSVLFNSKQERTVAQYISGLDSGKKMSTNNLTYYFYTTTDSSRIDDNETIRNWNTIQKNNYRACIGEWEKVSPLTFTEVFTDTSANIKLILIDDLSYDFLGHAYFPESIYEGENFISFNNADDKDFTIGSYDYITMVHEFGHTLGLAHPHDDGGSSTLFLGVSSSSDLGTNQQNQTVYTVMSYNDLNGPITPDFVQSYGFIKGPMAYDIAAINFIYSGTVINNSGNTEYIIPTVNTSGTLFETIVDTGGIDTINASGAIIDVTIDLRDARLNGNVIGGGAISKADGIDGGFTIANGTIIENAKTGAGDDYVIGSIHNNVITTNDGDDLVRANRGNDIINTGAGKDIIYGDAGNDIANGGDGNDTFYAGLGRDEFTGGSGNDVCIFPGFRWNYTIIRYDGPGTDPVGKYVIIGKGSFRRSVWKTILIDVPFVRFSDGKWKRLTKVRGVIDRRS